MKKKLTAMALAGALLLALPGCAGGAATLSGKAPVLPRSGDWNVAADQTFAASLDDFSARSSDVVLQGKENLCYSPVSLYYALALAGTGAAGETQKEIYTVLGAEDTQALSENLETLYRALYEDEKHCRVHLANSVWMQDGTAFLEAFLNNASENFYAESYTVDFAAPDAGDAIGKWISKNTKGLLKPEVQTSPQTLMMLLNTVYFKANWVDEFSKRNTQQQEFYLADGSAVSCDFMHQSRSGETIAVEGYTMASLPLEKGWQFFAVLPDEGVTIDGLLQTHGIADLLDPEKEKNRMVDWGIPKFKAKSELDLMPVLRSMGIEQAFSDTRADFSNLCDSPVFISAVNQGTSFAIDEEGVEAAAYTKIEGCGSAAPPDETIDMTLKRPFLYGVRDADGTILFLGRCDHPTL